MPKRPNKSLEIGEIPNNLEESYQVIVPTEKLIVSEFWI